MKNYHAKIKSVLLVLTLVLALGCRKNTRQEELPIVNSGTVSDIGQSDQSPKSQKVIGANGGTLQSNDGELSINIPAGALNTDQIIAIQRISNTNPVARHAAYRITPHIAFAKPVSITFQSNSSELTNKRVAYQDDKGIWQAVGGITYDQAKKTLTVQTTHFSDWSEFDCVYMLPEKGTVQPGQSLNLEVKVFEDFLEPLNNGKEKPISKPVKLADKFVKSWELVGPGTLKNQGAKAIYTAPGNVGSSAHATVNTELELGVKGKYILVTQIDILYAIVKLKYKDQAEIVYHSATANRVGDQMTISAGDDKALRLMLNWRGGLGIHTFESDPQNQFAWFPNDNDRFIHYYTDPISKTDIFSKGGITITDLGIADGFIKGQFQVSPAGLIGFTGASPAGNITGEFQVKIK